MFAPYMPAIYPELLKLVKEHTSTIICDGSGLFGAGFAPKPAWFAYVKFAGGNPN